MRARSTLSYQMLFGLLALCLFQMIGAAQEKAPPIPGKLVDAGGWRLHLNCTGASKGEAPTVVLEAGAGDFSFDWGLVQPAVARFARVCAYDRAGYAWSDAGPMPRTMQQIVYELHTGLANAGIEAPYVLVGHSLGGLLVRMYARQYPKEVAGMVLVDSSHEDQMISIMDRTTREEKNVRWRELASGKPIPPVQTTFQRLAGAAQMGASSGTGSPLDAPYNKLPPDLQKIRLWAMSRPDWGSTRSSETFPFLAEELAQMYAERGSRKKPLNDMPLIVLTNGMASEDKRRLQADLASLSGNSKHIMAKQSGHHIHLDEPAVVTNAIQQVVESAQHHTKLLP
jgi:pimeloyl-ACP methyl ester carboxylesterase